MSENNRDLFKGTLMLPCLLPKAEKGDFWIFDAPDTNDEFYIGGRCGVKSRRGDSLICNETNNGGHWCSVGEFFTIKTHQEDFEILETITLKPIHKSNLSIYEMTENGLMTLYENQEKILQAIKLINI